MPIARRQILRTTSLLPLGLASGAPRARADAKPVLRIGVLNDMSGTYRGVSGPVSVACVRQAIEDFGVSAKGFDVEVLAADHRNNPDVGVAIARQWCDRDGVDMIIDVPTSSVALAVAHICAEKNKVYINVGGGTSELTGRQCTPNTIHWAYDTYMLGKSTGGEVTRRGGKTWFFITADYVFGHNLQDEASRFVKEAGGQVLGAAAYPFPSTTDFSSYLVQAQASGAQVLGLANAGDDEVNCIKQAHEFGLTRTMKIAGLLLIITGVHALGLELAQGTILTEPFYWDLNDRTRAFTRRLQPKIPGLKPNFEQAGCYSATFHYLKVAQAMGIAEAKRDGRATVARMKATPWDDDAYGSGRIREDGRNLNPAYLFQVKSPAESSGPWDYYKLIATLPGDQVYRPLKEGGCPFITSG